MNRKDFDILAQIIRDIREPSLREHVAHIAVSRLSGREHGFREPEFLAACKVGDPK